MNSIFIFDRRIMAGRLAVNVVFFAITLAAAERTRQADHVTFGRITFKLDSKERSLANLLDTSKWIVHGAPIRINGVEVRGEECGSARKLNSKGTMLASVRTKRPTLREQILETRKEDVEVSQGEEIDPTVIHAISKPFVPKSIWSRLRGREFDQPEVIDALVLSGLSMTKPEDNEWITWKPHNNGNNADETTTDVRVHIGRCARDDSDQYYGAHLPMLKTEAVICMKPKDIADLLLDSSRVRVYNKMSIGRKDIREIACQFGIAKIVKNLTKPPITSQKIESTTFLHARQLSEEGTYLVVSRAVVGAMDDNDDVGSNGKSEILLGVNLLEPCDDQLSCKMTSVTHVYSPSLPAVLATRVGIKSAINFVEDIRSLGDPAHQNSVESVSL
jgi:hypothetical protein